MAWLAGWLMLSYCCDFSDIVQLEIFVITCVHRPGLGSATQRFTKTSH